MKVPVSVYCNRCDRWFEVEPEDQMQLKSGKQARCEDCGSMINLPTPHAWLLVRQRAANLLQSVFRGQKNRRAS